MQEVMHMEVDGVRRVSIACQMACIVAAFLLEGRAEDAFIVLSFVFMGAHLGALMYETFYGKEAL